MVKKRDGRIEDFNVDKLESAIYDTWIHSDNDLTVQEINDLVYNLICYFQGDNVTLTSESIYDIVHSYIYDLSPKMAESYMNYRHKRANFRLFENPIIKKVVQRLEKPEEENVNSNANLNELSFSGKSAEALSLLQKSVALYRHLTPELARLHESGVIYIHDLTAFSGGMHNCLTADISRCMEAGYKMSNGDLRPPRRFSTACQQLAIIFQSQSMHQFGGIAEPHFDFTMAKYVKISEDKYKQEAERYFVCEDDKKYYIDEKLREEIKQGCESLIHNLNSLMSRSGS